MQFPASSAMGALGHCAACGWNHSAFSGFDGGGGRVDQPRLLCAESVSLVTAGRRPHSERIAAGALYACARAPRALWYMDCDRTDRNRHAGQDMGESADCIWPRFDPDSVDADDGFARSHLEVLEHFSVRLLLSRPRSDPEHTEWRSDAGQAAEKCSRYILNAQD